MTWWQVLLHPLVALRRKVAKTFLIRGYCPECYGDEPYCRVCEAGNLCIAPDEHVRRILLWERWLEANPECKVGEPNGTV